MGLDFGLLKNIFQNKWYISFLNDLVSLENLVPLGLVLKHPIHLVLQNGQQGQASGGIELELRQDDDLWEQYCTTM